MMSLRIIEPERPGFDSRTFECPKCYDTETFVASISHEINVSIGTSPAGAQAARAWLRHQGQHRRLIAVAASRFSSNMR
jgi:hypothetical protein